MANASKGKPTRTAGRGRIPRPDLKPRKTTEPYNEFDSFSDDADETPSGATAGAANGKSKSKKKKPSNREAQRRTVEEECAQMDRDVEQAEEDGDRIVRRFKEKARDGRQLIEIEEQGRIDREGSDEKARYVLHADKFPDSIDPDSHYYDDFTGHWFWELVHPAFDDAKKRTPPDMQRAGGIPRWVGRVTLSWPERVLLAQLVYYFQRSPLTRKIRARRRLKDYLWVAKDDRAMAVETMVESTRTLQDARRRLKERGILVLEYHRFPVYRGERWVGLRVCHYRINWDVLAEAYLDGDGSRELLESKETTRSLRTLFSQDNDDETDDYETYDEDDDE